MNNKKRIKKLPLLIMEIALLMVAAVVIIVVVFIERSVEHVEINLDAIKVNEEVKKEITKSGNKNKNSKELTGYRHIALFGVDARDGSLGKGNRTDTIMICSVNMDTNEVRLISVYRDTYLNLGNDSYNKCNTAYAQGGPEQAINMLNMNMDMYITDYITVGFEGMIEAVDALGGIEIVVEEEEINHLNNYQLIMSEELDMPYTTVTKPGIQILNGMQATAYCRIRYTKGDDFRRAERQRDVLTAMIQKAKTVSVSRLTEVINALLPNLSTSLRVEDIFSLLPILVNFDVTVSDGFPFEDARAGTTVGKKGSCIVPNSLEENVIKLHQLLFAKEDYTVSRELAAYSKKIQEDTAKYIK